MDLIRDITRREKIRLALADADEQQAAVVDDEQQAAVMDDAPHAARVVFGVDVAAECQTTDDAASATGPEGDPHETFRPKVGSLVALDDVACHLPSDPDVPFARPVPFRDRLGVFLSDSVPHFAGEFPAPDDAKVTVFPVAFVTSVTGSEFRVHARPTFYGKPAYSFIEATAGGGELWYGRVWLLFQCHFGGVLYNLALVSWLTARSGAPFGTDRPTFAWTSRFTDCIEVEHLKRVVTMVPTFVQRGRRKEPVWHLLE